MTVKELELCAEYSGKLRQREASTRRMAPPDISVLERGLAKEKLLRIHEEICKLNTVSHKAHLQMIGNQMISTCLILLHWLMFLCNIGVESASDSPSLGSAFLVLTHSQATSLGVPKWHLAKKNRIVVPVFSIKSQHSGEWE